MGSNCGPHNQKLHDFYQYTGRQIGIKKQSSKAMLSITWAQMALKIFRQPKQQEITQIVMTSKEI